MLHCLESPLCCWCLKATGMAPQQAVAQQAQHGALEAGSRAQNLQAMQQTQPTPQASTASLLPVVRLTQTLTGRQ